MQGRQVLLLLMTRPRPAVTYCTETNNQACANAVPVHPERRMLLLLNLPQTKTPRSAATTTEASLPWRPASRVGNGESASHSCAAFRRLSLSLEIFLKKSLFGPFFFMDLFALLFCSTYAMSCPPLRSLSAPAVLLT